MRDPERTTGPVDAVRLTIRYGGDGFEIVKRTRVRKPVRPSDTLLDEGDDEVGFWAELRQDGRSVYRQRLVDAIARDVEVFTSDPDRPITRMPVDDPVGVFTIVVPDIETAELALVGPPRARPGRRRKSSRDAAQGVTDLAVLPLHDEPRGTVS